MFGSFFYVLENYKKRYPYMLVGEKQSVVQNEHAILLLYRVVGKRAIIESTANALCNDKNLISKFHPLDVRVIAFIAGVEQTLNIPTEQRKLRFEQLKETIFNHSK